MRKERKTIVYDQELRVEAYRFEGMRHPFPNHFHEHYVIGLVEGGQRVLSCKNKEYTIEKGSMILFNPGDNHACAQSDGGRFDYRGLNIGKEVMLDFAEEVSGQRRLPVFRENVVWDDEAACCLRLLHEMVMQEIDDWGKEEAMLIFLSMLFQNYGQAFEDHIPECREEIENACAYMEQHFAERLSLAQICHAIGLSKSTLLRAFTKTKGITPYRYLETIRINEAKKLLRQGVPPADAAVQTGFTDQSHFTNYFSSFTGLTPGGYREIFVSANKVDRKRNEEE